MQAGGSNVAVPPAANQYSDYGRGRSNSARVSGRLRAASEMQRQGMISPREKSLIKQLLCSSDLAFKEQFDKALKAGNPSAIKRLIESHPDMQDVLPDNSLADMTLSDVDDFASFLDEYATSGSDTNMFSSNTAMPPPSSGGARQNQVQQHRGSFGFSAMAGPGPISSKIDYSGGGSEAARKRQGSKSLPTQGYSKHAAGARMGGNKPPNSAGVAGGVQSTPLGPMSPMGAQMYQQMNQHLSPTRGDPVRAAAKPVYTHMGMPPSSINRSAPFGTISNEGDEEDERTGIAKSRKNERERKRRLAVTRGFDELYKLLKELDEKDKAADGKDAVNMLGTSKLDKASILKNSIEKIQGLELQILNLRKDNDRMKGLLTKAS